MPDKKLNISKNETADNDDVVLEPTEEETGEGNIRQKIKDLKEKLEACSKEKADYLSGWQRTKADYINLQKESDANRSLTIKFATEGLIYDIIPVLDSFEMAIGNKEAWNAVSDNWRTGVEYIHNQLKSVLSDRGVKEICPKEKDDIEFEHHAVVETVSTDEEALDGKISSVLQKGYELNGKILRPARVIAFLYKN